MIIRRMMLSSVILFNVAFVLVASYIAYNYDYRVLQDAFTIVSSLVR